MKGVWVYEIPRLPKLPNQLLRRHWRVQNRERDLWRDEIGGAALGNRPPKPLPCARVRLVRCSALQPDPDNLAASWKFTLDALVRARVLEDDRDLELECVWEKARPGAGRVRIEVRELVKRSMTRSKSLSPTT